MVRNQHTPRAKSSRWLVVVPRRSGSGCQRHPRRGRTICGGRSLIFLLLTPTPSGTPLTLHPPSSAILFSFFLINLIFTLMQIKCLPLLFNQKKTLPLLLFDISSLQHTTKTVLSLFNKQKEATYCKGGCL